MLTRTPAIHHQLISLIKRPQGTMVHPWPHHDAQDPQGLAKGDRWLHLFWGKQTQTRLEQKRWWNSLEIIKLYCKNEKSGFLQASSKTFCGRETPHGTNVSLVKFKSSTSELHCFSQHAWANPPCHFVRDSTSRCSSAWLPDADVPVLGVSLKPTKKHGM